MENEEQFRNHQEEKYEARKKNTINSTAHSLNLSKGMFHPK